MIVVHVEVTVDSSAEVVDSLVEIVDNLVGEILPLLATMAEETNELFGPKVELQLWEVSVLAKASELYLGLP